LYTTYGVTGFMLYDDELNVSPKIVELMNLIAKTQKDLGVEFRLRGFMKAELFTDQQAEAMYKAGFRWILIGFESGHERILTNIQKNASQADNTRAMEIAKRHSLKVKALMSVGHPGESEETVKATRDWLLAVKPDDFDATVITTYPGTPYFDEAVETKPGVWTYTYSKTGDRLHSLEVDYREVAEYYKGIPGCPVRAFHGAGDHYSEYPEIDLDRWREDRLTGRRVCAGESMRIALDVSTLARNRAGIGTYIAQLLTALVRIAPEHEFLLYTPDPLSKKDHAFLTTHPHVRIIRCPALLMGLRARWDQVDVFHGLNFKLRGWGRYGGVVTIYDLSLDRLPQSSRKLFGQRRSFLRTRRTARRASRVVTISAHSAKDIVELYGVPRERIALVFPAVGPEFYPVVDPAVRASV